jgi:chemotaxis protein histidine kinase CheA
MPNETVTPAATSTKTAVPVSDLTAAAAAGAASKVSAPPPPVPDAAAAKASADKAAADAAAGAAAGDEKPPSWHPPKDEAAKAAEAKAAEDKKVADAAAAAKVAAEVKIELKAPEGVKVEQAVLDKHLALAKELGLSQVQAQKLFETSLTAEKAAGEAQKKQMADIDAKWAKDLVQGWGADAVKNDVLAKRGWDAIDPSGALRKGLQQVGLLNWPVATNAMVEFAKKLGEDSIGAQSVGKSKKEPLAPEAEFERRYKEAEKAAKK